MGLFEMFPYADLTELNIQWVIDVCQRADKQMKSLSLTIESVVRPMFIQYENFIKGYYNQLSVQLSTEIGKVYNSQERLQATVNRQLAQNQQLINSTLRQVEVLNRDSKTYTEMSVSELRNEVNTLIRKYDAIFGANAAAQNSTVKKILTDFTREYQAQLNDNTVKMNRLQLFVDNAIHNMQSELRNTEAAVRSDMMELYRNVSNLNDDVQTDLRDLGDNIISEVRKYQPELDELYANLHELLSDYFALFGIDLQRKADIVYVDSEIQRVESLITKMKDDIIVINPVTSKEDTLQDTLYDMYKNQNPLTLTAKEYDDLRLSATAYDKVAKEGMTALEYDERGRWWLTMQKGIIDIANRYTDDAETRIVQIFSAWNMEIENTANERWAWIQKCCHDVNRELIKLNQLLHMSSPFDGIYKPVKDVILQMFSWIQTDTLTATQYDAKELTANAYDTLMLSAYDYDWHGATLVV